MKHRLLCALLALCLSLSAFGGFSLSAAEGDFAEDYDALLVKDGLVGWFDAYDVGNGTVDFGTGLWHNRAGDTVAVLGTSYWKARAGGGIGYDLRSYLEWFRFGNLTGIDFGVKHLPLEDFTVEFVFSPDGIVDEEGRDVYHTEEMNNDIWGLYSPNQSPWVFGALHFMQFMPSAAPSGSSLMVRGMYSYNQSYNLTGYGNCLGDGKLVENLHNPASFHMTFDHTAAEDFDGARYVWKRNGEEIFSFDNKATSVSAAATYLPNKDGAFRLFYGFPGTVYTVRVYDRVLSEEERRQNYFSDLCRLLGIDVSGVSLLSAEERAELFSLASEFSLASPAEDVALLSSIVAFFTEGGRAVAEHALAFGGIATRLDGAGLRASFFVDARLIRLLERKYRVYVGGLYSDEGKTPEVTLQEGAPVSEGDVIPAYETGKGECPEEFTVTVSLPPDRENESHLFLPLFFRGYLILEDGEGAQILYRDMEGPTFRDSVTFAEAADYFVNRYGENVANGYRYNESETLRRLLGAAGIAVSDFVPGKNAGKRETLFVAPTGKAGGDGTEASPFGTPEEAYRAAKALLARERSIAVTVHLLPGVHRVSSALSLRGEEIGAEEYWFTLEGEGAVLSGAVPIEGAWEKVEGKPYYRIPVVGSPLFRQLYINGELADLAAEGYTRYKDAAEEGGDFFHTGETVHDPAKPGYVPRLYLEADAFRHMPEEEIAGTEVHLVIVWEYRILRVSRVDFSDVDAEGRVAVWFDEEDYRAVLRGGSLSYTDAPYTLYNRLAFLDEEGEYFYDRDGGYVYYYPKAGEDIATLTAEYALTERILGFYETENVTLKDITVTGADNLYLETHGYYAGGQAGCDGPDQIMPEIAAVFGKHMRGTTLYGITVKNVMGDGVQLVGAVDDLTVRSCRFDHIGATGLRVGGGNSRFVEVNHFDGGLIEDNYLTDIARYMRQHTGIYVCIAKDVKILHNSIVGCSYSGISVGWNWTSTTAKEGEGINLYRVEIAYNYVSDFMTDQGDGGGIYTLGGNAEWGCTTLFNSLHHNYVKVEETTGRHGGFMPIYHDGASSNWHTYGNVVDALYPENPGLASIYLQIGAGVLGSQQTHNILVEKNFILGADWETPVTLGGNYLYFDANGNGRYDEGEEYMPDHETYLEKVIFWDHVRNEYGVYQRDNVAEQSIYSAPDECWETVQTAGSSLHEKE